MKSVIIIGAGPCGLAALKEILEHTHDAILFERSSSLGGLFASAVMYPNLHLTISNWAMAFSDFPNPQRLCYSSAEEYLLYLQSYAHHFDLERYITCNAEVSSAALGHGGRWSVEVRRAGEERTLSVQADALIVATGANKVPNRTPAGLSQFSNRIIHSSEYNEDFKREVAEKKLHVLVVGGGESSADISAELGELSPNVTVWLKRMVVSYPRYLNDANEMEQVAANKVQDVPANAFLEAITTNRMSTGLNVYAYGLFRRILCHSPVFNSTISRMGLEGFADSFFQNDQATYVNKNQRMCEAVYDKKIDVLVSPTASARGRTVEFQVTDGTIQKRDFDVVILCTGYRTEFPWLKVSGFDNNPRSWFLHCFPEGLGHCLSFLGYARPHQGGIPIMAEMLSRYIALLLNGGRKLPVDYAAQARRDEEAEREYYFVSPDLSTLVDYNAFLESVARRVGCEPRLPLFCILLFNLHMLTLFLLVLGSLKANLNPLGPPLASLLWAVTMAGFFLYDNGLIIKWWFYPNWTVWYRQSGPGAVPALRSAVLQRVNLWNSTAITLGFGLLVVWSVLTFYVQRLLSMILFVPHVILTSLSIRFSSVWGGLLRPKLFVLHDTQWRLSDLFLP